MAREPNAVVQDLSRIRSWITDGITLDFVSEPVAVELANTLTVLRNPEIVRARLAQYVEFQAVVELSPDQPCPYGVQPLHVIIKEGKKARLVIDLSQNLNDHLVYEYFKYSTVREAMELSTPNCWYAKLDLTNCFLSFPLHKSAWAHFIFRFDGKLYQFRRMPFGLSSAPRICTLLLSVLAFRLRQLAPSQLVRYLDDFLLIALSLAASSSALSLAQQVINDFGLVVNPDKTEGPAQQLSFLGIQLDSVAQTLSCTPARIEEIRTLLASALSSDKITLPTLATLIGKLQFASAVLPGARPFVRRMLDLQKHHHQRLRRRLRAPSDQHGATAADPPASRATCRLRFTLAHSRVFTDRGFREDVRFWQAHLTQWNGKALWRTAQAAPFTFASDASLDGFGFYLESLPPGSDCSTWPHQLRIGTGFCGLYSEPHQHLHSRTGQMSWCEMFAVFAALFTYRSMLQSRCALFVMDNETDVHILNRQATSSHRLAGLLREIYTISNQFNISIYARHRPGVDNVLADFLSRPLLHGNRDIPLVRQQAGAAAVRFYIDFALKQNTKKAYATHQRAFIALCGRFGIRPDRPLSESDLCLVVATFASEGHKITTVPSFVAAIANHALNRGHGLLPRGYQYDQMMTGLRNFFGNQNTSVPKAALTMSDLVHFLPFIDRTTFEGARDWCACILAFFGLLRVNEYMSGGLLMKDVGLHSWGVSISITFSKTSLIPAPVDIAARHDDLCPSRALGSYLWFFSTYPGLPSSPTDPLFITRLPQAQFAPTTDTEFISRIRDIIRRARPTYDVSQYAGHSFRRGGTSALKLAGVPDSTIQRHGRWKSDAYLAYIDSANNLAIRLSATQALLGSSGSRG